MTEYKKDSTLSNQDRPKYSPHKRLLETYFKEVSLYTIPTSEEELALFTNYRAASDWNSNEKKPDGPIAAKIKQKIAQCYLRFVIKYALQRTKDETLLLDLISAGNEGLLVGIKKFDPQRGTRFLTYGAWWIRVYIQTSLQGVVKNIKQPIQYLEDASLLPSLEAAADTTLSSEKFNILKELSGSSLTRKELIILIYYYGLRGGEKLTFSELSKLLLDLEGSYVSSERVRQIKEHAIRSLRKTFSNKNLTCVSDIF